MKTDSYCSTANKRHQRQRRPIAIDLFAGAGGFSLGIEQAGFDVAVAVEQDPVHAAVYAFNFPDTKVLCRDVVTLSGQDIQAAVRKWTATEEQQIDLVFGGPPCQGFSIMGKRHLGDVRNNLVFEFCRLVRELQPRYFVMENVPGLRLREHSELLEQLLSKFEAAGYRLTVPIQVLNAADFGVPQKRRRLFLLGSQVGEAAIAYPGIKLCLESPFLTVSDAIADLPDLDDFTELFATDSIHLTPDELELMHSRATPYSQKLRNLLADPTNFVYPRHWDPQLLTSSIRTRHTEALIVRFQKTKMGQLDPTSRLRRLDWNKPSHTLRAGTGSERGSYTSPRPIHPEYPRVISVREAARLHSFPDWFRFHMTKWHGFRQVGNAVPPQLGRVLGQQILTQLAVEPVIPTAPLTLGNPQFLQFKQLQAAAYWQQQEL